MRLSYDAPRLPTLEARVKMLEAFAEALVVAQALELAPDKDAYPCCVHCGELGFRAVPGMAGRKGVPDEAEATDDQLAALFNGRVSNTEAVFGEGVLPEPAATQGGPGSLRVQSARELSRSKIGHALELAIFQCAVERVRDKQSAVKVIADESGNVHAYVQGDDGVLKNPQDDTVSDADCGCEEHG